MHWANRATSGMAVQLKDQGERGQGHQDRAEPGESLDQSAPRKMEAQSARISYVGVVPKGLSSPPAAPACQPRPLTTPRPGLP